MTLPVDYRELAPRPDEGPIDLEALLPGAGPIEIDIGFGRGRSVLDRAQAAPDARILGIEVKPKWVCVVEQRLRREGLDRARVFAADARELLARSGPDGCVRRVSIHFPDPWWKKRHAKRRVVGDALLDEVVRLLARGGELLIQTDVEERAELYRLLVAARTGLEPLGDRGFVEANPFGARSNREVRAEGDGLPVWRVHARRA